MVNPIKDRVLDDGKGFIATEKVDNRSWKEKFVALEGEFKKVKKKLRDIDDVWNERRNVELVTLKDKVMGLEKIVDALRIENDRLKNAKGKKDK